VTTAQRLLAVILLRPKPRFERDGGDPAQRSPGLCGPLPAGTEQHRPAQAPPVTMTFPRDTECTSLSRAFAVVGKLRSQRPAELARCCSVPAARGPHKPGETLGAGSPIPLKRASSEQNNASSRWAVCPQRPVAVLLDALQEEIDPGLPSPFWPRH